MMLVRMMFITLVSGLAACGGDDLTCDEGPYQTAVRAQRVQAPSDLDSLEQLKEMPLPAASPRAPRPEGSPCLENPPTLSTG